MNFGHPSQINNNPLGARYGSFYKWNCWWYWYSWVTSGYGAKYGNLVPQMRSPFRKIPNISKKLITMNRFAQKDVKLLNEGKDVHFRRYEKIQRRDFNNFEGLPLPEDTLRQTTIKVTLEQYGSWVPNGPNVGSLNRSLVQQITERQAIQMAEQMDTMLTMPS